VRLRQTLRDQEKVDADDVIMSLTTRVAARLRRPSVFRRQPRAGRGCRQEHSHRSLVGVENGVYRHVGRAKVFTSESSAMVAIKKSRLNLATSSC
jgi:hypothetical protein